MTFGEARAEVLKVTFDRDLAGEIANIILSAIADEREACAVVADDFSVTSSVASPGEAGRRIATKIRARGA